MYSKYLIAAFSLLLVTSTVNASEKSHEAHKSHKISPVELLVYKSPSCGCCKGWISHIEKEGILAHVKDYQQLQSIKNKYGIKPQYLSCHTAVSRNGFAFEGHIPAKFIKKFLSEDHPAAIGLSVPAMPLGSPGMEMNEQFMPYNVLMLLKDGTSEVYSSVSTYEEQF